MIFDKQTIYIEDGMFRADITIYTDGETPRYMSEGAAGMDLRAAVDGSLAPLERRLVPTGVYLRLPRGVEAQIRPRSGLALKHGVTVLNSPGTIDSDYEGEIGIILVNLSKDTFSWAVKERIAQMVFAPVIRANTTSYYTDCMEEDRQSERGKGGFGSTGMV